MLRARDWRDLEACCGGPPGASAAVDAEYRARSPLTHLAAASGLPIDLNAGIDDGHSGSVPVGHSLRAFNLLARGRAELFSDDEIIRLEARRFGGEVVAVPEDGRKHPVLLRREAGPSRVTLFQGGHEGDAHAALHWFDGLRDAE